MGDQAELLAILSNKGGKLDRLLKIAALYMIAADALRSTVEGHARTFFDLDNVLGQSEDLPTEFAKLRSKNQAERLIAASLWFCSLDAFSEADRQLVKTSIELRNKAAHELLKMFFDGRHSKLDEKHIHEMLQVIHKANVWWLKNVEREISPFFPSQATDDELERSQSGVEALLCALFSSAFPDFAAPTKQEGAPP